MATLYHIISTGQSNSVGAGGNPALITSAPYSVNKYVKNDDSLVDLCEPQIGYQDRGNVESHSTKMCSILHERLGWNCSTAMSGNGGTPISGIEKGTGPYSHAMARLSAAKTWALANGYDNVVVPFVAFIHGEEDCYHHNSGYADRVNQLALDFDSDVKAITGQSSDVLLIAPAPAGYDPFMFPNIARIGEWFGRLLYPAYYIGSLMNRVVLQSDVVHYKNFSYQDVGEYIANSYIDISNGIYPVKAHPSRVDRTEFGAVIHFETKIRVARAYDFVVKNGASTRSFMLIIDENKIQLNVSGTFDRIQFACEQSGILQFNNGQYCHAFELFV